MQTKMQKDYFRQKSSVSFCPFGFFYNLVKAPERGRECGVPDKPHRRMGCQCGVPDEPHGRMGCQCGVPDEPRGRMGCYLIAAQVVGIVVIKQVVGILVLKNNHPDLLSFN